MGAGPVEVAIVAEEIGRVLAPEPFIETVVLAGGLVAAVGTAEQKGEILGGIAEGTTIAVFAHAEPGTRWTPTAPGVTATQSGDGWTLTGVKEPVPSGARADVLVVSAAVDGGTGLFLVAGRRRGPDPHRLPHPRRHPRGARPLRRHPGRARSASRRRPDRRDRAGAGRGPDRLRPRGARRHGHRAADHDGVPEDAQAVRRHPQQVPGADLPGGGHVRVAGAGPQHRAVGVDGAGGRRRRRRRPPTAPGCRSAGPAGTSARRPSSCTAASA